MAILLICVFIFIMYGALIIYYWRSWVSIPEYRSTSPKADVTISVIVPARNEEKNIRACIDSLCQQNYAPELLQIIVIDDNSTDGTWNILNSIVQPEIDICYAQLSSQDDKASTAHKKRAISKGISLARNELIVATDADCIHPTSWLNTIASFYKERNAAFIAAPVAYQHNNSILQVFQALDFLILQGITAAAVEKKMHAMCNGANLAYEKKAFFEVSGFEGIDNIASGDDMLLMHKIQMQYPGRVHYLKSKTAVVLTQPMQTWTEFINQRIRWASKAKKYDDKSIFWVLLLVYVFNLSLMVMAIAALWNINNLYYFFALWIAKTIVELPFVYSVAKYFRMQRTVNYFFFFQPVHIVYTIIAGWLGLFKKYRWKGRTVR